MNKRAIYPQNYKPFHVANDFGQAAPAAVEDGQPEMVQADVATKTLELFIWGEIGGWFGVYGQDIYLQLQNKEIDLIKVYVSSGGGGILQAFEIHDLLKGHPAKVEVNIFSLAASSATIISMAADVVRMSRQALFMIHEGASYMDGYQNVKDLLKEAEVLQKFNNRIVDVYKRKTGASEETIREFMALETWFEPEEALAAGFIDEVVDFVSVPFENAGLKQPDFFDFFFEHTASGFKHLLTPKGYAPIAASVVASKLVSPKASNSINNNPMKFSEKLASFLANVPGLSFLHDGKEVQAENLSTLLETAEEENTSLEEQILPEAVVNQISSTVADAVASIRNELKDEVATEVQETLELLTTKVSELGNEYEGIQEQLESIQNAAPSTTTPAPVVEEVAEKVQEVSNRFDSLKKQIENIALGKSAGVRVKDNSTKVPTEQEGKEEPKKLAFSKGSALYQAVVGNNLVSAKAIQKLEAEVEKQKANSN